MCGGGDMTARSGDCAAVLIPLHSTTHRTTPEPRIPGWMGRCRCCSQRHESKYQVPLELGPVWHEWHVCCLKYWYSRANQLTVSWWTHNMSWRGILLNGETLTWIVLWCFWGFVFSCVELRICYVVCSCYAQSFSFLVLVSFGDF